MDQDKTSLRALKHWGCRKMSKTAQSVKLPADIMMLVRREAEVQSRSVAGQIAHWLKIGRAIEQSASFDHARVVAALEGQLDTVELSAAEEAAWLDAFTRKMG